MTKTVYITTYFNQYPEDGYAIGNVYENRDDAEAVAETQEDIKRGYEQYSVIERELK